MKTIKEVIKYFNSKNELYDLIESAILGGASKIRVDTKQFGENTLLIRPIFDYKKLKMILNSINVPDNVLNEILEALTYCDGTCNGCIENNGSGCDAIAIFHQYIK